MSAPTATDLGVLLDGARSGRSRDVARLLSLVEDGAPLVPELMRRVAPMGGTAVVVGITGSPGVGKSTATSAVVSALRARGQRVAVLAVDPSSPFSGGALLGDRVRMAAHATDAGVFVRSMASRGHLGGLAAAAPQAIRVLDAAGFDVVLVETVGVGQSEVEIAATADTTLVLVAPGMGDSIQAAKAGVLEIADVLVVNKADLPGADATVRDLRNASSLRPDGGWTPPVVRAVAETGEGIEAVVAAIDDHMAWARGSGALLDRRLRRARDEVQVALAQLLLGRLPGATLDAAAREVADGRTDAFTAARQLAPTADVRDGGPAS